MSHTPGPWRLKLQRYGGYRVFKLFIDNPDGSYQELGDFRGVHRVSDPDEETIANARLIAAAPDLLEALAAIVNSTDYGADDDRPLMQAARAAIAKAERAQS